MKICMFAKGLPVHVIGGLEIHTQDLIEGLAKNGHRVTVICTKHPRGVKTEKRGNIEIFYVGDKSLKFTRNFCKESMRLFRKLDKKENFDVVHSQSTYGFGFAKYGKGKKPFVITMHGGSYKDEIRSVINGGSMKILFVVPYMYLKYFLSYHSRYKFLFREAKKIINVSEEVKKDLIEVYKIPEKKMIVIPSSLDVNKFKPINVEDFRKKLGITEWEKVIVSTGRISKQKGYHLIIEILPDLLKQLNVKLVIVGHGEYLENLKNLAQKRKVFDNIIFAGKVSENDLIKYYNLADVFVFPTMRLEGLPLTPLEAMACERPVITTRIGGIPTAVKNHVNGILISPGNLIELKRGISEILNQPKLSRKLAENARKTIVENFNLDKMIYNTIKVYEDVL